MLRRKAAIFAAIILMSGLSVGIAGAQRVIYVDDDAPLGGDGSTWETAYDSLSTALTAAQPGDQIWVAAGRYVGKFTLPLEVEVYGGFAGTETEPSQRDWTANPTILDGNGTGTVVVSPSGATAATRIDGFTITNGSASRGGGVFSAYGNPTLTDCTFSGNSADDEGGGMYNYRGDPTLTNCTFSGNSAYRGGGMYNDTASPTLTDCVFISNSAGGSGGGMYSVCYTDAAPVLANCTFTGNSADYDGGGMYNYRGDPALTNCTFSGNSAGGSFAGGGGMYNLQGDPTLTNCRFSGNSASGGYASGGGLYICRGNPTLAKCTFSGNSANGSYAQGGGMYIDWGEPTLTNCTFSGNSANGSYANGGGMFSGYGNPTLVDCTFSGNSADQDGGGMFNSGAYTSPTTLRNCTFSGNEAGVFGGGMSSAGDPTITNCTFSGNSARSGGGMFHYQLDPTLTNCSFSGNSAAENGGGMYIAGGSPTLTNCILWGNTRAGDVRDEQAQVSEMDGVTYSCIEGWEGIGVGNTGADPLFVDPGYWDDNGTPWPSDDIWIDGDYHLQPGSPCIEAGDNTAVLPDANDLDGDGDTSEPTPLDLDGLPRFADDALAPDTGLGDGTWPIVDMGAYERADCDGNDIRDEEDIAGSSSIDENGNGYPDECEPTVSILTTEPPDCAIDARQPCDPDGSNPQGWQVVKLDLDGASLYLSASDFDVTEQDDGVDGTAPSITSVAYAGWQAVELHLSERIEPGGWTTITHIPTGETVRLGCLPGDVSGDRTSASADILWVIDCLNGVRTCEKWQCDVDRSDVCGPPDILRVIDLLNGAGEYGSWLNVSIPECPPPSDPVQITIDPGSRLTFSCEKITLSATTTPTDAAVVWTQVGGPPLDQDHFTDKANGTATFTAPIIPDQGDQDFAFEARASAPGYADGRAIVVFTLRDFTDTTQVATTSTGAAQPGEIVTLALAESVPATWLTTTQWEQNPDSVPVVALSPTGDGQVEFVVPSVDETTDLHFTVTTDGCLLGRLTGSVTVPIQVAQLVFDLPSTITIGGTLDLDDDNNPDTGEPILTIIGAPAYREILFFASAEGGGELPPDVDLSIDRDTGVMTVSAGVGDTFQVTVQVFGTAGLLAEASDTIEIVAP